MLLDECLKYANGMNASEEVLNWCNTTLAKAIQKPGLLDINLTQVEHILDYLVSDSAPKRLRKMSYSQALANADKWSKANQKKGRHLEDGPGDLETIHDFSDGSKIVKLLTPNACKREGFLMNHCVGSYDPERTTLYSYRDKKNQPHATFEVQTNAGQVSQIKGKGNGPIHPKYIDAILAFLRAIDQTPRPSEMRNLGYHCIPAQLIGLYDNIKRPDGSKAVNITVIEGVSYLFSPEPVR